MEFQELLKKRHSVRAYSEKPVEKEKIGKLLEAIFSAPSAGNLQAYKVVIVKDEKTKEKIYHAALEQGPVLQAPIVLVFFADQNQSSRKYGERGANLYSLQDATIAAAYAQLAAADSGLGSVWVGAFDEIKVAKILDAKEGEIPIAVIPIGYPASEISFPRLRRKKSEIATEI